MATIKPVIVKAKALKDGRHKVRISLSHNGEFRYLNTDIIINSTNEFKNGQIVKRQDAAYLNTKLRGLLQQYQQAIDSIEYINGLTCTELVFQMKMAQKYERRTLVSIYEEYIQSKRIKESSKEIYSGQMRNLLGFFKENTLVENITSASVYGLEKHLTAKGLSQTSIRNNMIFFSMLVNFARRCGYVSYKVDPFVSYRMPRAEVRDLWLTVEQVRTIRDCEPTKNTLKWARDLFMLSYYLGGINFVDLYKINFDEVTDNTIRYVRTKTELNPRMQKFVEFKIPPEASKIISNYKMPNGYLSGSSKMTNLSAHSGAHIKHIKNLGAWLGIGRLCYYSARKSFSQHAFDLGVETSVIDYILGHKVGKTGSCLFNYIQVTPEMATNAIKKVLENLRK